MKNESVQFEPFFVRLVESDVVIDMVFQTVNSFSRIEELKKSHTKKNHAQAGERSSTWSTGEKRCMMPRHLEAGPL